MPSDSTEASPGDRGRVLLIGLDSADAELIERWSAAGQLPTFRSLADDGCWARLATTSRVLHVSAWPTLHTGTSPGAHGMYHAYQIKGGEQEVHRTAASECGVPPFWKYLDDAGARCIVFDAFMNSAVPGFGGIQVLEYGTWTWFDEPSATPDGTWRELQQKIGPYPAPEHTKIHGQPPPQRFRDDLLAGVRAKERAARWLMREKPWDFFYLNFGEAHPAGHYLWHVQDPSYPTYPAGGMPGLGDAVLDVYRAIDDALAGVLEELGENDTVIVTSGDGMGPNFSGCHLIPEALHRLDLYHAADVGKKTESGEERPRKSLLSSLRGLVPPELRRAVSRCLPPGIQHRLSMKWANADIDWERTRAFCIPNANEAFVRLNLEGREPRGNVARGADYGELVERLKLRLGELVNPATGLSGPDEVIHVEDVFAGPRRGDLPDVIVTWNPAAKVLARLESEACGHIDLAAGHQTAPYYTGNHRPLAFALARGPGVSAGARLEGGHILDVAPTVTALLGREPPPHYEGRVWSELV